MKTMIDRGQINIAIELMKVAGDMRISHRRRLSALRYAREVLNALNSNDRRLVKFCGMIEALEQYDVYHSDWTHTDIKRVVQTVRVALQEYYEVRYGTEDRQRGRDTQGLDDIPF